MSHSNASVKSIVFALLANLGIAITKTVAAAFTGSGSMLAEAIHSYADCGNQGLLFLGLKKAKKAPDPEHPLGHGKEIYFWSFVVAIVLFSVGGIFSIYEGIHKLSSHEGLKYEMVAIVVLIVSIVLESASLYGCLVQIRKVNKSGSLWNWIKNSRQSELIVVLGEDVAALLGLIMALVAVVLAMITGNPFFDAAGSIAIGALLVLVSLFLAIRVKGLLIGQSADRETEKEIRDFLNNVPEIEDVLNMITLQLGSQMMVSVKAKMRNSGSAEQMITAINQCEAGLKERFPEVQWVFFEPDIKK